MTKGFPAHRRALKAHAEQVGRIKDYDLLRYDPYLMGILAEIYRDPTQAATQLAKRFALKDYSRDGLFTWLLDELVFRHPIVKASKRLGNKRPYRLLAYITQRAMERWEHHNRFHNQHFPTGLIHWPPVKRPDVLLGNLYPPQALPALSADLPILESLGLVKTDRRPGYHQKASQVSLTGLGWAVMLLRYNNDFAFLSSRWLGPSPRDPESFDWFYRGLSSWVHSQS
jgi:hypothetical protein